ncbi:MAG: energy transducer TonB [Bacteroidetes bacterium]|nr:energy transducer TonB [Bacteroidota bacterium]
MELKKSIKADVSKKTTTFFLIGMLVIQLVTLGDFSYTWYDKPVEALKVTRSAADNEVIEQTEITQQPAYYVPPPPPPTSIEIVPDDQADDDVEIQETEFNDETVVQTPYDFYGMTPGGTPGAPPPPTHVEEAPIFTVVEIMPEYPGGQQAMLSFIQKNFNYPDEARRFDVEGRVLVSFLVDEQGNITDVKPLLPPNRQLGYGLEDEAVRVVKKMPKWKPGFQRNKAVRVRYTLPINCTLN